MEFAGTVRMRTGDLMAWFIDLCWGHPDLRCSLAVHQSLFCLAHVAPGLNRLCWAEYKGLHEGRWWDLSWCSQGDPAKPADVGMQHYQPAAAEPLGLVISNPPQLGSCEIALVEFRGICVMNFSWLTMGKDLSHTHRRGLWSAAGNHWWVKTSGSLLSLTLTPIQTHGRLPISLGVNKGKHKTPLFSMALCSRGIFSAADDPFAYPKCLIKYIHQNEDSKEVFLSISPSSRSPPCNAYFTCHPGNPDMGLLSYFTIRVQ